MKLTIFKPFSNPKIEIEEILDMYVPNSAVYFTTDKDMNVIWMETEIQEHKREVEYYKKRYDNILKGLCYWKSRALK